MDHNGAFCQAAGYVPPGGTKMEKQRREEQWDKYQRQLKVQRSSMGDISEDLCQPNSPSNPTSRKRADSLQPKASPQPTRSRRSTDADASLHSTIRSSNYHEDNECPRRISFAEHYQSLSPIHSNPHGEIRRLSGNFNAPTYVELERQKEHKRRSRGIGKLKNTIKALVRA